MLSSEEMYTALMVNSLAGNRTHDLGVASAILLLTELQENTGMLFLTSSV